MSTFKAYSLPLFTHLMAFVLMILKEKLACIKVYVHRSHYWVHIDSMIHFLRCALLHLHIFILLILHYRFLRQILGEHSTQRNRSNNRGRKLQPEIITCEPAWVRLVQQTRWTRHPQCLRWERSRGDACFLAVIGVHGSVCASPQ